MKPEVRWRGPYMENGGYKDQKHNKNCFVETFHGISSKLPIACIDADGDLKCYGDEISFKFIFSYFI